MLCFQAHRLEVAGREQYVSLYSCVPSQTPSLACRIRWTEKVPKPS